MRTKLLDKQDRWLPVFEGDAMLAREYKSLMQPTSNLPIPGYVAPKQVPVVAVRARTIHTGRKFREA